MGVSLYVWVYVNDGMKSNTPPHPKMSPSPSTILLKGLHGSGFVNLSANILALGQ